MPVKSARRNRFTLSPASAGYCCSIAALLIFFGCDGLQNATANGETRTISFHHIHTKEDLTVTYKRNGRYDEEALKRINHLMRDWREDEPIKMDPHLIDAIWEVHREVGATEPIRVICGYRSSGTNSKLRRRSSGVAKFSQHMLGKAIDFQIPGVPLENVRAAGLRAERGGVGFYPSSGFVHMDTGSVRHWPRMPEAQLASVMSKGKLGSRLASDSGRGVAVAQATRKPAFLSRLFGGDDEDHAETAAPAKPTMVAAMTDKPATKPTEKAADKPAAKPADKSAEKPTPVPQSRPAPAKPDSFQLASATAKPAPKPETFQVASATSRTVAVPAKPEADAANAAAPATFQVASANSQPVRPAQAASLVARANASANDVINERGYWQGLPSAEPAETSATGPARAGAAPRRPAVVASADPKSTASVASASLAPWPLSQEKNEPAAPSNALAYAAQPATISQARPAAPMGTGHARPAVPAGQTTVAVKRSDDRPVIAPQTQSQMLPQPQMQSPVKAANAVRAGDRFNDPWMRAMIVSPSAQGFMRTTLFGMQDFRNLGSYLQKPASAVMMTFSGDPHLGLSADKFGGSAVVFISTVTFKTRTASLR